MKNLLIPTPVEDTPRQSLPSPAPRQKSNPTMAASLALLALTCLAADLPAQSEIRADFNGDGYADLAIGAPYTDDAGAADAGAVFVIYGSATGLTAGGSSIPAAQHWTQETLRILGTSDSRDRFGAALAAGDFNHDGFSDLAIGVPGEVDVSDGVGFNGRIVVIYGSAAGLSSALATRVRASQSFSLEHVDSQEQLLFYAANSIADLPANYQLFGTSLACGDFNGDGVSDLAVGAPSALLQPALFQSPISGGAVAIFFGTAGSGLSAERTRALTEDTGAASQAENGDRFGAALSVGDFNGDQISDLAIGIPGEKNSGGLFGPTYYGAVEVVPGAAGGLDAGNADLWRSESPSSYVGFGTVLAAGDFDGNGKDSLLIALPSLGAGGVFVIEDDALNLDDPLWLDQDLIFGPGNNESGDTFGHALAVGDFNADGRADLAIGAPYEDLGNIADAGEVSIVYGSSAGLAAPSGLPFGVPSPQRWNQNTTGIEDSAEAGDRFGYTLTASNFGRNQTVMEFPLPRLAKAADLAIGVPFEGVAGVGAAGAVNVLYGRNADRFGTGLTSTNNQLWTPNASGAAPPQSNARFGQALP